MRPRIAAQSERFVGGSDVGECATEDEVGARLDVNPAADRKIDGTVNGPVEATEHLDLQPKARVNGDIRYSALEMHHGAIVQGALSHMDGAKPALKLASSNTN